MRKRCKQNAPERMMRVISKSCAFCLSFHWGFRLQREYAAHAGQFRGVSRKIDAKSHREACRSLLARQSMQPDRLHSCKMIIQKHGLSQPERDRNRKIAREILIGPTRAQKVAREIRSSQQKRETSLKPARSAH